MIPDAAVNAALDVLPYQAADYVDTDTMRAALEAAAPHLLAQGWDEGVAYVFEGGSEVSDENPYRTTPRQKRTENGTHLTSHADGPTP